jgi:hypothetical protein
MPREIAACSHTVRGTRVQCQLPAGHEGDHIAPGTSDQALLDAILRRALDERFNVNHVTRWLELAVEVNAGNRDMFPNEIEAALRGR